MRLPNKLFRFSESVFADMTNILTALRHPSKVYELYQKVKNQMSVDRYIEALEILFALDKIIYEGELIYVS